MEAAAEKSNRRHRGIRLRILAAFSLVAVSAAGAAIVAWITVSAVQQRLQHMARTTLPMVVLAEALAKEAALFALLADNLSRVENETARSGQVAMLEERLVNLRGSTDRIEALGFDRRAVKDVRKLLLSLDENLKRQNQLAIRVIGTRRRLEERMDRLRDLHGLFIETATARVTEGYNSFLDQGNTVSREVLEALQELRPGANRGAVQDLQKKIRIGFTTLINSDAAEMRANLEMVAVTYLAVGILNEVSGSDRRKRIADLEGQFHGILESAGRIRLVLSASTPENRAVLLQAMPIIAFGRGADSIFTLRGSELALRQEVAEVARNSRRVADALNRSIGSLVLQASQRAESEADDLGTALARARLFQAAAAITAFLVALAIGWLYVGRKLVRPLLALRSAMEGQARGEDVPIPPGGRDELGDMVRSLHHFVEQRRKTEADLRKAKEEAEAALAEVKQLSGLLPICSHCKKIRDDSGYWNQLEAYISVNTEASFSHSICPDCAAELYPGMQLYHTDAESDREG
jgi:hypothetical protein